MHMYTYNYILTYVSYIVDDLNFALSLNGLEEIYGLYSPIYVHIYMHIYLFINIYKYKYLSIHVYIYNHILTYVSDVVDDINLALSLNGLEETYGLCPPTYVHIYTNIYI
jgi:hypothetical protein